MENKKIDEYEIRKKKLDEISKKEIAYKEKYSVNTELSDVKGLADGSILKVAGRIIAKRVFGKLMFIDLYDINGTTQISISKNEFPEDYSYYKQNIDIGDFIGIDGELYTTGIGERTIRVNKLEILSKALRPLPEKYHGITDNDIKYRQRYLDIISNDYTRNTFKKRIQILNDIKDYLRTNKFVEVETPILQSVACGANARPFETHHNSLNEDYFLRIAPELFLKQVVESGFNRVFEMGKNFRNEGMDASHLQEFTMLEWYAAYWDYIDNMIFLEKMIKEVIEDVNGHLNVVYQGINLDFSNIEKLDYSKELSKVLNRDILEITDVNEIKKVLKDNELFNEKEVDSLKSITSAIDYIFKRRIRPYIISPTMVYNYPAYMVPLARRNDSDERIIDMFQLIVNGWEISKCYSELINPQTQRKTFLDQAKDKAAGDEDAMSIDEDFILAMEHGMPPMSGLGMGIDRFVSLLTDEPTLRDVVLFPQMKKIKKM